MKEKENIILFDGECNLCVRLVRFTIERDAVKKFRFGSLQSAGGIEKLRRQNITENLYGTFIYLREDKLLTKSTAALQLLKDIGNGWQLLFVLILVPRFIRDWFYMLISKSRYTVFGKRDICWVPEKDINDRFIE